MTTALQAVAEPNRQRILALVWTQERSASEIAAQLDVTFGATSQHLGVLRQHGFVTLRQEGRRRYYRAKPEALGPLADYLQTMWRSKLGRLKALAEEEERHHGQHNRNSARDRG